MTKTVQSTEPVDPETLFSRQQIVMMLTNFSGIPYSKFVTEYLPHITSLDHFHVTLAFHRRHPRHSWPKAASLCLSIVNNP